MEGHSESLETTLLKEAKNRVSQIQIKIVNLIELRKKSATDRIMSRIEIDRLLEELTDEYKAQVERIQRITNKSM